MGYSCACCRYAATRRAEDRLLVACSPLVGRLFSAGLGLDCLIARLLVAWSQLVSLSARLGSQRWQVLLGVLGRPMWLSLGVAVGAAIAVAGLEVAANIGADVATVGVDPDVACGY